MSNAQFYRQKPRKEKSRPALDLLDEAFHRLRTAPPAILGLYYAGSLPFILGLLYFWADLSHSADAERYGTGAALGLAVLFLWMKTWQAAFALRLRALFNGRPAARWSVRAAANLFLVQGVLQSAGLFGLWIASILVIPTGWAYAFCQSATAIGAGETGTVREVLRRSGRGAALWPRQNHVMLLIMSLLGLFVWLNVMSAVFGLPQLFKLVTGEENVFTRGGVDYMNSTFFLVTFSLVYLLIDPVMKTFYALRCFYADSQYSGEDLRSELRALPAPKAAASNTPAAPANPGAGGRPGGSPAAERGAGARRPAAGAVTAAAAVLLAASLLAGLPTSARASAMPAPTVQPSTPERSAAPAASPATAPASAGPGATNIRPPELDKSIEEVMHRREFAWRVPPKQTAAAPSEAGFFDSAARWTKDVAVWIGKQITRAYRAVRDAWRAFKKKWLHDDDNDVPSPESSNWAFGDSRLFLQRAVYVLIALIVCGLLYQGWKTWRRRAAPELAGSAASAGAPVAPDLRDEELLATQLPEDEWLQLARRLSASGEHRLALRAVYLSILALLGTRGLLAIARHKSNRDYLTELRRRARDRAELQTAFSRNVNRYERVWYGPHPASLDLFDQFLADRQIIADSSPAATAPPVPV